MPQNSVEGIDQTIQTTNTWLREVGEELHTDDRQKSYLALRAVLRATRDQLTVDEAAQLGAQLPMLVRGIYYDGWDPSKSPERLRDRQAFLERVSNDVVFDQQVDPTRAVKATMTVLNRHVSEGEMREVLAMLPAPVRELAGIS